MEGRRKLIVNSDHDRTLCKDFSTTLAIRFNSRPKPKAVLERLMVESINIKEGTLLKRTTLLPEDVVHDFLASKGKKELETLEDIARCGEWGLYEDGRLTKEALIIIKGLLLEGLREEDLKKAASSAGEALTDGAVDYAKAITRYRHFHVIVSDGWKPIVEATANALRDCGARIDRIRASVPFFDGGIFKGSLMKLDKFQTSLDIYRDFVVLPQDGVYRSAVMVDDSAQNIKLMKRHGLAIAFCPTEKDAKRFEEAKIAVQAEKDLRKTFSKIKEFSRL